MKLVRYGRAGAEKPGLIDDDGKLRDLSRIVKEITPDGLPVGLQIVGRHQDDWGVLQLAHAFEQATGFGRRRPPVAA